MKKEYMEDFLASNKEILNNPVIKSFLEKDEHYQLVKKAMEDPSEENKRVVDEAFKDHYSKIKLLRYISNLIHFFSIDYDKKIRKLNERYTLTLDKPLSIDGEDGPTSAKDFIVSDNHLSFESIFDSSLKDSVEDKKLSLAIEKLTSKQIQLLEMVYLNDYQLKEIADLLETTPQNISNQHNKAINKLYKELKKD